MDYSRIVSRVHSSGRETGKRLAAIVSFLRKRAWKADCLFLFLKWKRNTWISNVSLEFRFNSGPRRRWSLGAFVEN